MKTYDITFKSCNSEVYPKPITAYVVEPTQMDENTGLMHFAHGWAGNRFGYKEMQEEFADRYNLVGVGTEYRMSGFDFDPVVGRGATLPYDVSNMQVIDCLNALRTVLGLYPDLNKKRIFDFGGSQGGHVAMLMSVFAPDTFALVISACGISQLDEYWAGRAGRSFDDDELAIRNTVQLAPRVKCPVVLMHGTADEAVEDDHTRVLEKALLDAGQTVVSRYYEGGNHQLGPVTNRRDATVELADNLLRESVNDKAIDFSAETEIRIPCVHKQFVIDWSKPVDAEDLVQWEAL
jgi:dienelactone hydrolase